MSDNLGENLKYSQFLEHAFPPDEREQATIISIMLNHLAVHALVDFNAALDLYDYCEMRYIDNMARGKPQAAHGFARQSYVPARDGAMTIFHFGETFLDLKSRVGRIPNMHARVYTDELKLAYHLFHGYFPNYRALRNSVAHITLTLAKISLPDLTSPTKPFPLVRDRRFRGVWEKREVSYDLTVETRAHLERVLNVVCLAFRKVYADCEEAFIAGRTLETG